MNYEEALRKLKMLYPCPSGLDYARKAVDPRQAWETCDRPDWMMWMVVQLRMDLKLVKDCIREVLEPFKNHPSVVIADRYRDSWLTNRGCESITDEEFVELTSSDLVSMMCYVLVLTEDGDAFSAFEGLPAEFKTAAIASMLKHFPWDTVSEKLASVHVPPPFPDAT